MNRFNVILDTAPEEKFGGYVQKTDFKQVLKFFRVLVADDISDETKTEIVLRLFFTALPDDPWGAIQDHIAGPDGYKEEEERPRERVFDYNTDHGRLFAAFLQAYGIDLRTAEMHWWTFLELFMCLPEDTKLMQVIEIRSKKPGKHDSDEYKKQLRKMKDKFRIDDGHAALEAVMDRG